MNSVRWAIGVDLGGTKEAGVVGAASLAIKNISTKEST